MTQPLIQIEGITKRFGGVTALDGVGFSIAPGEAHAVVGGNGAGKSTLMKILAGMLRPDDGRILLDGVPMRLRGALDARGQGISIVSQELNLFPHRSVAANLFVNRELRGPLGLLDRRAMRDAARRALGSIGVEIDPDAPVGRLSVGARQLVEIARALDQRARIVILDEPNSALGGHESSRLFETLRRLRDRDRVTFVYVSHRLDEVFAIADRITVLRDGRYQGTERTSRTSVHSVVEMMAGEPQAAAGDPCPGEATASSRRIILQTTGLAGGARGRGFGPLSFAAHAGEIVGFVGVEGAGIDALFNAMFGLERLRVGSVTIDGRSCRLRSPGAAMQSGLALVPSSRRDEGLFMGWSIRRNAVMLALREARNRFGLISRARSRALAARYTRRLNVVTDSLEKRVAQLSGGNQQKVLLGKWLATAPRVMILNDPTRGVDVGAKAEIHRLCTELAAGGMAILFSSSEWEETLALADRTLVLRAGRVVKEFARGGASKAELLHHALAGPPPTAPTDAKSAPLTR